MPRIVPIWMKDAQYRLARLIDSAMSIGQFKDSDPLGYRLPWTNQGLANRVGVSARTVANWRRDTVSITPENVVPLLEIFYGDNTRFASDRQQMLDTWHLAVGKSINSQEPILPAAQQHGPHFQTGNTGNVEFVPPSLLNSNDDNVPRLRQLHPVLQDLARDLVALLSIGNTPHAHLRARAKAYRELIDTALDNIDSARLFVEGIRLANAHQTTNTEISTGDLPSLNGDAAETIASLLQIHGPFMLATQEGVEIIAAEERHRRRPNQEREYRAAATDFAASLQDRPDIAQPDAADTILGAAEQAGLGPYPERSAVIGMGTVRNATIALTASAMTALFPILGQAALLAGGAATGIAGWFALLAANETVKHSAYFKAIVSRAAKHIDEKIPLPEPDAATARLLAGTSRVLAFVLSIEPKLRRLEKASGDQSWLGKTLDWMKDNAARPEKR